MMVIAKKGDEVSIRVLRGKGLDTSVVVSYCVVVSENSIIEVSKIEEIKQECCIRGCKESADASYWYNAQQCFVNCCTSHYHDLVTHRMMQSCIQLEKFV